MTKAAKALLALALFASLSLGWAGSGENMPDVGFTTNTVIMAGSGENMPDIG